MEIQHQESNFEPTQNILGAGSTISNPQSDPEEYASHSTEQAISNRKILVVDDSLTIRMQVKELLERNVFHVLLAEDGPQCLKMLEKEKPDAILLDIIMPEMDGIEVCQRIKSDENLKDIPILILTTVTDVENKVKGLNAGADDYITKPFEIAELTARLNAIIRNKMLYEELRLANRKILEQQKSVIEEERLKVLLQMAGATAHELSQPLMNLLGNIDLMRLNEDHPEKLHKHMDQIEKSGQRVADIVRKIQAIRHDETKPYLEKFSIINFDQKIHLLSVEDSDDDFEKLSAILKNYNQVIIYRARNVKEAFQVLEQGRFDLIFLDYFLPDGNGQEFLRIMGEKGFEIPVVIITGKGDETVAAHVIQAGAYDYLPKDVVSTNSLCRVISSSMEKFNLKKQINEAHKKMAEMATKDELTGLYNRRYFTEALERELSVAKRYETELVFCMMDLDDFKKINDSYGHPAGDMALCGVARILKECCRKGDLICRYGGEEFAVLLPNTRTENALIACERFREMVSRHQFKYNSSQLQVTISIGIASFNASDQETPADLIANADKALYKAKEEGRNRVVSELVTPV